MEPRELFKICEKANNRLELEHKMQHVAVKNAIGLCFHKGYKYIDLFKQAELQKKELTAEEEAEMISYLENW